MKGIGIAILCTFCVFGTPSYAATDANDIKYTWSYGALADTMKPMRRECEETYIDPFTYIGNWMRNNGAKFSLNELSNECLTAFANYKIDRHLKACQHPYANQCQPNYGPCGERQYTNDSTCNIFISTFIKNNNVRANILKDNKPGTYVKEVALVSGKTVYKVVDVILASGYWKKNTETINNDINNSDANTKIYKITDNGIVDTGLHTWTNDMFFDVRASRGYSGDVTGAFVNSYIYPDVDLTADIYDMYDRNRGIMLSSVGNTWRSRQEGEFDVKYNYAPQYKVNGQKDNEQDSNGVLFNGKIAHFDWLGHFLFGMNRQEAVGPNKAANAAAHTLSFVSDLQERKREPENMQNAWNLGSQLVKDNKSLRDNTFKGTQTKKKEQAFAMAKSQMQQYYPNSKNIKCSGNCNRIPNTDDVVICMDEKNNRIEFVFDDICD